MSVYSPGGVGDFCLEQGIELSFFVLTRVSIYQFLS